jgi:uncharacterized protein (UPF0333 family)
MTRRTKKVNQHNPGQSMVEFALILPLMVLVIVGIFELGRAFFAFIAISNAAREGVRMYTFTPDDTTIADINITVRTEIGTSSLVDPMQISDVIIACPDHDPEIGQTRVNNDTTLAACPHEQWVRVTVKYNFDFILNLFFSQPITLTRSAEMVKP